MSDFFLGEIRVFSYDWAPRGWALCNGAVMQVSQNVALSALLGTQFGGDGRTTFALPDLRGRVPLCAGRSATYGAYGQGIQYQGGAEGVALTLAQVPIHTHYFHATSATGNSTTPVAGGLPSSASATSAPLIYGATTVNPAPTLTPLNPATVEVAGGGKPHQNMQPFLVMNFCISTLGIFPSRW